AVFLEMRYRRLADGPCTLQIGVDYAVPYVFGHLFDGVALPNSGICNDDVEAPEFPHRGIVKPLCVFRFSHIGLDGDRSDAEVLAFADDGKSLGLVLVIIDDDIGPGFGKSQGRRPANATRGTGNDCRLAAKQAKWNSLFYSF